MDEWPLLDDDRPNLRPVQRSYVWPAVVVAIVLIAGLAAAYYWWTVRARPAPAQTAPAQAAAPAPEASQPPAILHPLAVPEPDAAKPLPTLDKSDTMMRQSLVDLMGAKPFAALVVPGELIRRIVATIDNLPRRTALRRMNPLKPVQGRFAAAGRSDEPTLAPANFARYAPYVRVLASVDARALVHRYVRVYPLFQRAYEELGYPGRHFNDRLIEAIDDMAAAPEVDPPIALIRPRVLYEFADPELEARSAGQKLMLRMGSDNASRVKAKLREIRRELIAAGKPKS